MRSFILFLILNSVIISQWREIPQNVDLNDVLYIDKTILISGQDGTLFSSQDNGNSWDIKKDVVKRSNIFGKQAIGLFVMETVNQKDIFFATSVGLVKYNSESNNYENLTEDAYKLTSSFYDIKFTNELNGWAVSQVGLLKTTTGGYNFTEVLLNKDPIKVAAVLPFNADECLVFCADGILIRTVDGGSNFEYILNKQIRPRTSYPFDIFYGTEFINNSLGVIVGNAGLILRTTNGGSEWTNHSFEKLEKENFYSVTSDKQNRFWACSSEGKIVSSTNGGVSWFTQNTGTTEVLRTIKFKNGILTCVGEHGLVMISYDLGKKWEIKTIGTTRHLNGALALDSLNFIAVGDKGDILFSRSGGRFWVSQFSGTEEHLKSVCYIDSGKLAIAGEGATLLLTNNSGLSWKSKKLEYSTDLLSIAFLNKDTGIVVGTDGHILQTSNGGNSWVKLKSPTEDDLLAVTYTRDKKIFASSEDGKIFVSSDNGNCWENKILPEEFDVTILFAASEKVIFAGGRSESLYISTDGGLSWSRKITLPGSVVDVFFNDEKLGTAICKDGIIYKTYDAGFSWEEVSTKSTSKNLNSIFIINNSAGLIVGDDGTIIITNNYSGF
jgi:photosystem II stability/assembly factor-like uncharacterized protein